MTVLTQGLSSLVKIQRGYWRSQYIFGRANSLLGQIPLFCYRSFMNFASSISLLESVNSFDEFIYKQRIFNIKEVYWAEYGCGLSCGY